MSEMRNNKEPVQGAIDLQIGGDGKLRLVAPHGRLMGKGVTIASASEGVSAVSIADGALHVAYADGQEASYPLTPSVYVVEVEVDEDAEALVVTYSDGLQEYVPLDGSDPYPPEIDAYFNRDHDPVALTNYSVPLYNSDDEPIAWQDGVTYTVVSYVPTGSDDPSTEHVSDLAISHDGNGNLQVTNHGESTINAWALFYTAGRA